MVRPPGSHVLADYRTARAHSTDPRAVPLVVVGRGRETKFFLECRNAGVVHARGEIGPDEPKVVRLVLVTRNRSLSGAVSHEESESPRVGSEPHAVGVRAKAHFEGTHRRGSRNIDRESGLMLAEPRARTRPVGLYLAEARYPSTVDTHLAVERAIRALDAQRKSRLVRRGLKESRESVGGRVAQWLPVDVRHVRINQIGWNKIARSERPYFVHDKPQARGVVCRESRGWFRLRRNGGRGSGGRRRGDRRSTRARARIRANLVRFRAAIHAIEGHNRDGNSRENERASRGNTNDVPSPAAFARPQKSAEASHASSIRDDDRSLATNSERRSAACCQRTYVGCKFALNAIF